MKAKQLLILLLTGTLSFTLVGCNEPLEDNTIENPVEPDNGGGDGGGDDGSGDGGDDGSGDGGDDGEPIEYVGTWENKDEDGDGVPDEQDDYPFDAEKSTITVVQEEEFNNNVAEANPVGTVPFSVEGALSLSADIDDFKFTVTEADVQSGKSISFIILEQSSRFHPQLGIFKNNGQVVEHIELAIDRVAPLSAAIAFTPTQSGEYNLSVLDRNGNHADDFKYQAFGFIDADKDAIPDNKEQAQGLNYKIQDSDRDGIADGNEYWVFSSKNVFAYDVDGDSVPNWSDDDSDGDGIPDTLEGTADHDNDQLPAFVDLDSDNNTISDKDEQAQSSGTLIDTNRNGIPDYIDIDDDGDAVFDVNDTEPKTVLAYTSAESDSAITLASVYYELSDSISLPNKGRVFRPLNIIGENFPEQDGFVVITKGDERLPIVNMPITQATNTSISIVIPNYEKVALEGEELSLFIVKDNVRSNDLTFQLLHPKTPLIKSISTSQAVPGEQIQIEGESINDLAKVVMGEGRYEADWLSNNLATFVIPNEAASGLFYLQNVYGKSNSMYINIDNQREVTLDLNLPAAYRDLQGEVTVIPKGTKYSQLALVDGQAFSFNKEDSTVSIWYDGIAILSAGVVGNESALTLSLQSTAEEYVLKPFFVSASQSKRLEALSNLRSLEEYDDYLAYFKEGAEEDFRAFFSPQNYELSMKMLKLRDKVKTLSYAEQTSTNLSKKSNFLYSQQKDVSIQQVSSLSSQSASSDSDQKPKISPEDRQDGIKIEATRKGITDLFDYDGYTELQNSTPMYLSAAVYELDDQLDPMATPAVGLDPSKAGDKPKTYSHITSLLDRDMLSPVNYRAFAVALWSKDSMLKVCQYKNCLIEVLTPGYEGAPVLDSEKLKVSRDLFIRNAIDHVILPSFEYITDLIAKRVEIKKPIDDEGFLVEPGGGQAKHITYIIIQHMPGVIDAIDDGYSDGDMSTSDQQDVIAEIKKVLEKESKALLLAKPGPIVKAIFDAAGFDIEKYLKVAVKDQLEEYSAYFIPYLNIILFIYDTLSTVSEGVNLAENWYDLFNLKTKYEFRVNWGLKILKMTPEYLQNEPTFLPITITGIGLCPQHDWANDPIYPEIRYTDITSGFSKLIPIKNRGSLDDSYSVNSKCTEATVYVSGDVMAQVTEASEIEVEIILGDEIANSQVQNSSPPLLKIGSGLAISSIEPDKIYQGNEITINGFGFSEEASKNIVKLKNSDNELITVNVISATNTSLKIKVPQGAVSGELTVTVGDDTVSTNILIQSTKMKLTFGDNGNIQDDSFQLKIDGTLIDQTVAGQRQLTKLLSTEPGEKSVELTGITVPDNRATYFICFSSNVEVLSGDLHSKVDFADGEQFKAEFNINVMSAPVSEPVGCKFADTSSKNNMSIMVD
ncbi:MAG: IPT/TIG domain-containing protein [Pseudoalteromonas sp.]|uniref:IPT/TIG domain-containing protein n=1 Tax=unclassified Pseudoalteromonas TaxID=194690 RepID=UPI003F9B0B23